MTKTNKISGELELRAEVSALTSKDMSLLQKLGFVYSPYDSAFIYRDVINGERFVVKKSFNNVINIEHAYQVEISEPFSDEEILAKSRVTPVTQTADAVLVIPVGILYGVIFFIETY